MPPTCVGSASMRVPGPEADIPYLLRMALDKVPFLAFSFIVDKWRWGVFSGQITPEHYNEAWWDLVARYQQLKPPAPRPADAFDPGAKFHVADNTPYARYFLAYIYEFQFYRAACRLAGWQGPINRCSVYRNREVGAKLNAMLQLGQSKPWPQALAAFSQGLRPGFGLSQLQHRVTTIQHGRGPPSVVLLR